MKKVDLVLLVLFIALAGILNYLPHLNYQYPLHVDEYVHFQYSNHLSTGASLYFGGEYGSLEAGFHYLLASLNVLGVPYLLMFNFFPVLVTILICLGLFVFTRKMFNERAAVFSVLFFALLRSSVAILGPVFLVPMAIGMFLIVTGLYLIKIKSKAWMIILPALLVIHPPSAMAFLLLINIKFLGKLKEYPKNLLYQLIAGLIALPLYIEIFLTSGIGTVEKLAFTPLISALYIPRFLGWGLVAIALLGIYVSVKEKRYSVPVMVLALSLFAFAFYRFELDFFIPYPRALMYLFLLLGVMFGLGCSYLLNVEGKWIKLLMIVIITLIAVISAIPKIQDDGFYHIMNEGDYAGFIFIKENTAEDSVVLVDSWKANALTPFAERAVYSRIVQGPNEFYEDRNNKIDGFFSGNCSDSEFLNRNNISLVYGSCENLEEVYPGVYSA